MTIDYAMAIVYLLPNAQFTISSTKKYEDIVWEDDRIQPTKQECEEVYPQAKYESDYAQTQSARQRRYVEETDGLFFDAMRADQDLTQWKAAVAQIKADLPYPTLGA